MNSCRALFKTMEILPFYLQYIFSLLLYVVKNKHLYTRIKSLEVHNHDTRSPNIFHLPSTNLTKYLNGAHFAGIKIFSHLPTHVKCVANEIQVFKLAFKAFSPQVIILKSVQKFIPVCRAVMRVYYTEILGDLCFTMTIILLQNMHITTLNRLHQSVVYSE